jgi:UDP-galactopyranose mutase
MGNRVFVIEEPMFDQEENSYTVKEDPRSRNLWIVVLQVSRSTPIEKRNHILKTLLNSVIDSKKIKNYVLWYYSPMALIYSNHLYASLIIYDCMDELSAFKFAPPELRKMEISLMNYADIVFTGGYSLYHAKKHLHHNITPFPSSIDKTHFEIARSNKMDPEDQASIPHPRFGFYGVIDERFHISLIDELSSLRPEWHFILIGPIIKIDTAVLPKRDNLHYLGGKSYEELPLYLSGWDVAIIPFALNESTRYISPTKTPEYLAAGKPVISTSIADIVTPYGKLGLVHIADTAEEFIVQAEEILNSENKTQWLKKVDNFLETNSWDETWLKMSELIGIAFEKKGRRNMGKNTIENSGKMKIYV